MIFECDDLMSAQAFLSVKKEGCVCVCVGVIELRGGGRGGGGKGEGSEGGREGGRVCINRTQVKQASKNKVSSVQYGVWTHIDSFLALFHSSTRFL